MERVELSPADRELIQEAIRTSDRLHLDNVHEVAAAVRTKSGEVFVGIHTNASAGWADVCGEVAADPLYTPLLLGLGYTHLSANVGAIPYVKQAIRNCDMGRCRDLVEEVLACTTCLKHFNLVSKLKAGTPTSMVKSVELMMSSEVVCL